MKSLCTAAVLLSFGITTSGALAQNYAYYKPKSVAVNESAPLPAPERIQSQAAAANPQVIEGETVHGAPAPMYTGNGGCATGNCGTDGGYGLGCLGNACGCCSTWYVNLKGLVMTRDQANNWVSSYETGNNENQLMGSRDASAGWGGGFEVFIGYNWDCQNAIEVGYFGIWGMSGLGVEHSDSNQVSTPLDVGGVTFNGNAAASYFDNAREHRIGRDDEAHNIEINWVHHLMGADCSHPIAVDLIAGVRWFNFYERFRFLSFSGTAPADAEYADYPSDYAYLDIDTNNNLIGFQIGTKIDWQINCKWSMYLLPKIGIYGNHMTQRVCASLGDGTHGMYTADGTDVHLSATKNGFSVLSSLDLGLNYKITNNINIFGGYRLVAATGLALSDNQIYPFLAGKTDYQDIKSNGNLLLHGAFAGVEFTW